MKLNFRDASAEVITTITAYSHPRSKTAAEFARLQWSLKSSGLVKYCYCFLPPSAHFILLCLTLLLAALISAIIAALAMVYYAEYDFEWSFCGNIFDFEGELLPNRFILVRYLYIVSITLNYLLPVTATIWFYSEVLESLREFEAPTVVVEAVERLILLDGYLLLWLSAPIHMLELIQLMHWKEELPHGNVYVKVLTMIAGAYCIMHPICRLVLNKTFRNK